MILKRQGECRKSLLVSGVHGRNVLAGGYDSTDQIRGNRAMQRKSRDAALANKVVE